MGTRTQEKEYEKNTMEYGLTQKYMRIVDELRSEGITDIGVMISELDKRMSE